ALGVLQPVLHRRPLLACRGGLGQGLGPLLGGQLRKGHGLLLVTCGWCGSPVGTPLASACGTPACELSQYAAPAPTPPPPGPPRAGPRPPAAGRSRGRRRGRRG